MTSPPFLTVAMPCRNERDYIEACLRSVLAQDYPAHHLEILVADGASTDGTRSIIEALAREDPRLRLLDNPDRLQAPGLNRILRAARGDVIVRMDVHCEYAPDYLRRCVEALERTGADAVGGAQRAKARSVFQRAVAAVFASPLGAGGAAYRDPGRSGFVDTVFLGAYRRRVFETVGLYDAGAVTNEDSELNQRIIAAGGRIYLDAAIEVHYYPRDSLPGLARQYFRYGRGRARTLLKHKRLLNLRPALPLALVTGLALLFALRALRPAAPWVTGAYLLVCGAEATRVARALGLAGVITAWLVLPVMHMSHGLGFAAGLVRYSLKPDWAEPERLLSS